MRFLPIPPTVSNEETMRAAIYARVSTHDQNTIPMQVKKCREYAKARKWTITHTMKVNRLHYLLESANFAYSAGVRAS